MAYEFLHEITEAGQFRTKSRTDAMGDQQIKDFAFMDMNSLYVLYNEPQYKEYAQKYARDTLSSRNFDRPRVASTDLYNAIYQSKQAGAKPNETDIRRYLGAISNGTLKPTEARGMLQRMENSFDIRDTKLKSIRRKSQEYANLTPAGKKNLMPLINRFYLTNGKYGQLYSTIQLLGAADGTLTKDNLRRGSTGTSIGKLAAIGVGSYALGRLAGR